MQQCGRCGWLLRGDPRFCSMCNDGVADAARVQHLLDGIRDGSVEALGLLAEICDPAAFDAMVELTGSPNPYLRRAAVSSLGFIRDRRALPVVLGCVDDDEDMVVRAAIDALAELGGEDAEAALTTLSARPEHRSAASTALDWLARPRSVDEIIGNLSDPRLWGDGRTLAEWTGILAAADDTRALGALTRLMEQVRGHPRYPGAGIVVAVGSMTLPERLPVLREWARIDGPEGSVARRLLDQLASDEHADSDRRGADEDARSVRRWEMRPRPVDDPITDLVTKFGGQPVWRDGPRWPVSATFGLPMTFLAQFRLPAEVAGDGTWMAYLFFAREGESFRWDGGDNALIVQPGPTPAVETTPDPTGPTYTTAVWDHSMFRRRRRMPRQEYAIDLQPGLDPETWSDDVIEDRHGDWNKIGGTPRWLQRAEVPDGRMGFAFQFTVSAFGTEFGDGAEAYGFVGPDGRGAFLWQCH